MRSKVRELFVCAGACALVSFLSAAADPKPPRVTIDFTKEVGVIKPMNAGNNGPKGHYSDQMADNYHTYKMLNIPYARVHDANLSGLYGAPHTIDVWAIFKDPTADPTDPKSYDFVMTDFYLKLIASAGTEPYYRLGGSIEHYPRKFFTCMPVDHQKFAVICEHIIRHVTGDFANGLNMKVTYWEIWNEADLDWRDDAPNKRNWQGTADEFFDLFCTTFLHLKKTFPALKIGGPAAAGALGVEKDGTGWTDRLFKAMERRGVKLDFYSWHNYDTHPDNIVKNCRDVRAYLDSHGQSQAENHLNEWNYVKDWSAAFVYSCHQIAEIKGAAFALATMLACQHESLDLLMYYDFRPSEFCGLWKTGTYERQKPWWAYSMFGRLARLGTEVESQVTMPETYAVAAKDGKGRKAVAVCLYSDDDNFGFQENVRVKFAGLTASDRENISVRLLDAHLDCAEVPFNFADDELTLNYQVPRNAALLITF